MRQLPRTTRLYSNTYLCSIRSSTQARVQARPIRECECFIVHSTKTYRSLKDRRYRTEYTNEADEKLMI